MTRHWPTAPADGNWAGWPDWVERAECRELPDLFGAEEAAAWDAALAVCRACPVLTQCRDWSVTVEVFGVCGGLLPSQRWRWGRAPRRRSSPDHRNERGSWVRQQLAAGTTRAEVAAQLGVSPNSVTKLLARSRP